MGYFTTKEKNNNLPKIRNGVLTPLAGFKLQNFEESTIQRLNFFYARDYDWTKDVELIWKGIRQLGQ